MQISSISTARRLLLEFQPGVSQPIQASVGGKVTPVTLCLLKADVAKKVIEKYRESLKDEEPVVTEGLSCAACGRVYPIVSDIPVMLVEEALPADARVA